MKPTEIIGDCVLYQADCLEVMPTLPLADLCVSDVPYKLTTGGKSKSSKTMSGIFAAHNYENHGSLMNTDCGWSDMAKPIYDVLKPDADCYIMCNDKNVQEGLNTFIGAGFSLHNILTWDKKTPTANRWYMKNIEFTLYLWKGRAKTINDPSSKQGVIGNQIDETDHPTEKPVWLMQHYIENSSQHGQIVIDPFMGSGTTGVACVKSGRRFLGIELESKFFDMACKRIEAAHNQPEMFSQTPGEAA